MFSVYFPLFVRSVDHEKPNDKRAPTNSNNNQLDENCSWWPQIDTFKDTTKRRQRRLLFLLLLLLSLALTKQRLKVPTKTTKATIKITTTASGITRLERCSTLSLSSVQSSSVQLAWVLLFPSPGGQWNEIPTANPRQTKGISELKNETDDNGGGYTSRIYNTLSKSVFSAKRRSF